MPLAWRDPDQDVLLYRSGSIYSGTKSIYSDWTTEAVATGVNIVRLSAGTVDVNFGWGETETEASATKRTVPAGETRYVLLTAQYIGWQGTESSPLETVHVEQSVFR